MQSTTTTRRIRTAVALGLTIAFAGTGTAMAADTAAATTKAPAKAQRIAAKGGGTKAAPSKQKARSALRQLGLQKQGEAPKKMTRGLCTYVYYYDGVVAHCFGVGGATGWVNHVWLHLYGTGVWVYKGWYSI
jgi:hypothetical protein